MASRSRPTFRKPLQAACVEGKVVITGPEHMHGAFSAKAARESARILQDLADKAHRAPPADDQPSQTRSSEP